MFNEAFKRLREGLRGLEGVTWLEHRLEPRLEPGLELTVRGHAGVAQVKNIFRLHNVSLEVRVDTCCKASFF